MANGSCEDIGATCVDMIDTKSIPRFLDDDEKEDEEDDGDDDNGDYHPTKTS